jgi:hypothetical protein
MSVSSLQTSITYATNGTQASFAIPYYFIQQQDILVQSTDSTGNVITYNLNFDYVINGVTNVIGDYPNGGTIVFNTPPPTGLTLLIQRITTRTQEVQLVDGSVFNAAILNHVFDKEMLLIQEGFISGYKGLALGPPTSSNISYAIGDFFKNANPIPGYMWGWICTQAGPPGVWNSLLVISL